MSSRDTRVTPRIAARPRSVSEVATLLVIHHDETHRAGSLVVALEAGVAGDAGREAQHRDVFHGRLERERVRVDVDPAQPEAVADEELDRVRVGARALELGDEALAEGVVGASVVGLQSNRRALPAALEVAGAGHALPISALAPQDADPPVPSNQPVLFGAFAPNVSDVGLDPRPSPLLLGKRRESTAGPIRGRAELPRVGLPFSIRAFKIL
ncbi:MAG: hypothetical protein Q8P18_01795 [Pseudomonadota bacterium]|nr:hypothetical protein [Pseudomonadota bacterium]